MGSAAWKWVCMQWFGVLATTFSPTTILARAEILNETSVWTTVGIFDYFLSEEGNLSRVEASYNCSLYCGELATNVTNTTLCRGITYPSIWQADGSCLNCTNVTTAETTACNVTTGYICQRGAWSSWGGCSNNDTSCTGHRSRSRMNIQHRNSSIAQCSQNSTCDNGTFCNSTTYAATDSTVAQTTGAETTSMTMTTTTISAAVSTTASTATLSPSAVFPTSSTSTTTGWVFDGGSFVIGFFIPLVFLVALAVKYLMIVRQRKKWKTEGPVSYQGRRSSNYYNVGVGDNVFRNDETLDRGKAEHSQSEDDAKSPAPPIHYENLEGGKPIQGTESKEGVGKDKLPVRHYENLQGNHSGVSETAPTAQTGNYTGYESVTHEEDEPHYIQPETLPTTVGKSDGYEKVMVGKRILPLSNQDKQHSGYTSMLPLGNITPNDKPSATKTPMVPVVKKQDKPTAKKTPLVPIDQRQKDPPKNVLVPIVKGQKGSPAEKLRSSKQEDPPAEKGKFDFNVVLKPVGKSNDAAPKQGNQTQGKAALVPARNKKAKV